MIRSLACALVIALSPPGAPVPTRAAQTPAPPAAPAAPAAPQGTPPAAPAMNEEALQAIQKLQWLADGGWSTSARATGGGADERWLGGASNLLVGIGRTFRQNRVVFFEYLRIEARPDGLYYVAQLRGNPPIAFKMTKIDDSSVTFENPAHDNPKIITYRLEGRDTLIAELQGDEKGKPAAQRFTFQRQR